MANIIAFFVLLVFVTAIAGRNVTPKSNVTVSAASDGENVTSDGAAVTLDGNGNATVDTDEGDGGGAWASVQAYWRNHWVAILGTAAFMTALWICCRCCCFCKDGALLAINMPYSRVVNSRV